MSICQRRKLKKEYRNKLRHWWGLVKEAIKSNGVKAINISGVRLPISGQARLNRIPESKDSKSLYKGLAVKVGEVGKIKGHGSSIFLHIAGFFYHLISFMRIGK